MELWNNTNTGDCFVRSRGNRTGCVLFVVFCVHVFWTLERSYQRGLLRTGAAVAAAAKNAKTPVAAARRLTDLRRVEGGSSRQKRRVR